MTHPADGSGASPAPARARIDGLDALRLAAVCAVVVLHVVLKAELRVTADWLGHLGEAMLWAVPTLFVISGYLAGSARPRGFLAPLARRMSRLLIPYVFWLAVYVGAASVVHTELGPSITAWMFRSHLWFLLTLALCAPAGLLLRNRYAALAAALLGLGLLVARYTTGWVTPLDWPISATYPFLNWLELYLVGVVLGRWLDRSPIRHANALLALALPVLLATLLTGWIYWMLSPQSPSAYVAMGAIAVALTLLLRVSLDPSTWIRACYRTSLGIYVMHPMVATAFAMVVPVSRSVTGAWVAAASAFAIVASALITLGMARVPLLNRVVE